MNEFRDIVKSTSGVRLKCDPNNWLRCANAWEFEWVDLRELKLCVTVRECAWMLVNACECMWMNVCEKRFIKNILWNLGGKGYFDEFVSWDEYEKNTFEIIIFLNLRFEAGEKKIYKIYLRIYLWNGFK
jgi:hypothetical protein